MKAITFFLVLFSLSLKASVVTGIAKIEDPLDGSSYYQVLAYHDGAVYEVERSRSEIIKTLDLAQKSGLEVELKFEDAKGYEDAKAKITEAHIVPAFEPSQKSSFLTFYEPTNVKSMEKANQMFEGLYQRNRWWTQCYNRAHIWNRQMHKDHGVKSEKIFIFYTSKYRREHPRWKWWFHVAPLIRVNGEKVVMDKEFAKTPLPVKEWEMKFNKPMERTGYRCKKIDAISVYYSDKNNREEYCNIQITPMYYWEPSELKKLEEEGEVKTRWVNDEIRSAAAEIFRGWRSVYEEYKVP